MDAGYHADEDGYYHLANGPRDLKPNRIRPTYRANASFAGRNDVAEPAYGSTLSAPVEHLGKLYFLTVEWAFEPNSELDWIILVILDFLRMYYYSFLVHIVF